MLESAVHGVLCLPVVGVLTIMDWALAARGEKTTQNRGKNPQGDQPLLTGQSAHGAWTNGRAAAVDERLSESAELQS